MVRDHSHPTLLVFTLGPECEQSRRRLLPGPLRSAEAQLHRQGLERALTAGRSAGFRIVVSSPETLDLPPGIEQIEQHGSGFADRLRRAIRALLEGLDGAPLVVVGTDAPDLSEQHLLSALSHLETSPEGVVLGPAHDGGFYLLATRAEIDDELTRVRWCSRKTRHSLELALHESGRPVRLLRPLRDLDRYADVELWLLNRASGIPLSWLRRWLSSLLAAWRRPPAPSAILRPSQALIPAPAVRGPPL